MSKSTLTRGGSSSRQHPAISGQESLHYYGVLCFILLALLAVFFQALGTYFDPAKQAQPLYITSASVQLGCVLVPTLLVVERSWNYGSEWLPENALIVLCVAVGFVAAVLQIVAACLDPTGTVSLELFIASAGCQLAANLLTYCLDELRIQNGFCGFYTMGIASAVCQLVGSIIARSTNDASNINAVAFYQASSGTQFLSVAFSIYGFSRYQETVSYSQLETGENVEMTPI